MAVCVRPSCSLGLSDRSDPLWTRHLDQHTLLPRVARSSARTCPAESWLPRRALPFSDLCGRTRRGLGDGCLPLAEKLPLLPVTDPLGQLSRLGGGAPFEAVLEAAPAYVRPEVARLLPSWTAAPSRSRPWSPAPAPPAPFGELGPVGPAAMRREGTECLPRGV
jgi:hypothetical protein